MNSSDKSNHKPATPAGSNDAAKSGLASPEAQKIRNDLEAIFAKAGQSAQNRASDDTTAPKADHAEGSKTPKPH